ncbi:uncharacterized protein LOC112270580 [Brachypodium distachyon]|uniref:uncharacterized protein LOC112270580 n=1 Tax=Brachypodium distachyon TaxID=15368 RepID=UPI000D0D45A1|nr:uncharacterized protein LOC112270580 [Brachypodium distachyon]|eukprot:XP_024314073.1 uncharacterized protein LOC112270580 [Brachypodium distachyon]
MTCAPSSSRAGRSLGSRVTSIHIISVPDNAVAIFFGILTLMLDRVIGKKQSLYLASNRASSCWSTLLSCILSSYIYFALFKRPRGTISRCLHLLIFGPEVPAGRWEEQGNNRILRNSGQ